MSHVADVDLKVTDLDALEAVCDKLGLELRRGQTSYKWYGSWLNDWNNAERAAAMRGHDPKTFGQCEHAIGVKGRPGTYEIGLVRRLDGGKGYDAIYDAWAGGNGLEQVAGVGLAKLRGELAAEVCRRQIRAMGYSVQERTNAAGEVQIVGVKY